ncbi:unnamed protein product [Paramecium sonneborni]|uniref:MORN repeat protein n=1 Tax=Paramecium sonneborni TaxID=65129 RepID=A0A8S1PPL9_9CILI|nr:unnamed protein product [Paramecium sonneborni]
MQWLGNYGYNNKKIGKWMATWNGKILNNVGGLYSNDGLKQGLWKELNRNYMNQGKVQVQVYESGSYLKNQRCGIWIYVFNGRKIGGGSYNKQGFKDGKWIELRDGFNKNSQVTYNGQYQNGKKVALWDIFYENKKIGGGLYNEGDDEIKIGRWIEESDGFYYFSQITFNGEYKKGKKIGLWESYFNWDGNQKIGGGLYDEVGDEIKIGRWIDFNKTYKTDSQVTYNGEYINGKKVGRWNIWFNEYDDGWNNKQMQILNIINNIKIFSGGGLYDQEGNEIKIGRWVEQSEAFFIYSQVTYVGEYKNNKKVGRWDIWYNSYDKGWKNKKIGGGTYNKGDDEIKIGKWTELSDRFNNYTEIIYQGEYKHNQKVGKWEITYDGIQSGGGQYDEDGKGIKIGNWIEFSESFHKYHQLIYDGQYKNGKKIGRWMEMDIKENKILDEILFDDN